MKILKERQFFENVIYNVSIGFKATLPEWKKDKLYLVFDRRSKEFLFKMSGKRAQKDLSIPEINSQDWIIYR